jgi:hypothetical protein
MYKYIFMVFLALINVPNFPNPASTASFGFCMGMAVHGFIMYYLKEKE